MDVEQLHSCSWFREVMEQVQAAFDQLVDNRSEHRPALQNELNEIEEKLQGWSQSLGNSKLSPALRQDIESKWAAAHTRAQEIQESLAQEAAQATHVKKIVAPEEVVDRLNRLAEVLAKNNPTMGNLELSLHIDRIDCFKDGRITLRTSKLGALAGVAEYVKQDKSEGSSSRSNGRSRRRTRLQTEGSWDRQEELNATAHFAADPDRFAGLGDEWFWADEFQIPDKQASWAAEHAEEIFQRRQDEKLSYEKLANIYGKTPPTIRAAVKHYEETHRGVKDEVNLPRGGQRPRKIDIKKFGEEARQSWESGTSELKLAERFSCSPPTVKKAIKWAYEQLGQTMPTREGLQQAKMVEARRLRDQKLPLHEIARAMKTSDVTVRRYIKMSFAAEGNSMPDLRRKAIRRQSPQEPPDD